MSNQPDDVVQGDLAGPDEVSQDSPPQPPPPEPDAAVLQPEDDKADEWVAEAAGPASVADATVESVIEAILFASDEPLPVNRLAFLVEAATKQIHTAIDSLNQKYEAGGHAFRIEKIAGGMQMLTLPQYNGYLRKLLRVREDSKLSPAALETLAIVAYKQPVIRADVEAIRGVACGEVLRSLMVKGLVRIVGRAEIVGRPMQYGTTRRFLEVFGLNSLKDLPSIEELKRPEAAKPAAVQFDAVEAEPAVDPAPQAQEPLGPFEPQEGQ
jgi:segregation and condensation protein B